MSWCILYFETIFSVLLRLLCALIVHQASQYAVFFLYASARLSSGVEVNNQKRNMLVVCIVPSDVVYSSFFILHAVMSNC